MIGRKVMLVQNGQITEPEHFHPFVPDLHKIKFLVYKNIKKYGYLVLVTVIRLSIRSSNFIKTKIKKLSDIVKKILVKNKPEQANSPKEVSKFLRMISDYKHKISKIKHRIKEEEGIK